MAKQEFLNFKEISEKISFEEVLNWLNIPFKKSDKELKTDNFIISIEKNLFFCPANENVKGSVINFVANNDGISLREAASKLKNHFLSKENETQPKRDIPNLTLNYHDYLKQKEITPEVAEEYEVGFVKQRSVMSGRIAFKIYYSGENLGYIGYKIDNDNWFFPKGFKRPLYNAHKIIDKKFVIVTTDPFDTLRIISMGVTNVVSLLANSMTAEQEEELKKFRHILLLHKEPQNIVNRLTSSSFVKAPILSKPLKEITDAELITITSPEAQN